MKIAFLIAGLHEGGAERVVTNLANQMSERGHDVRILVTWTKKCVYDLDPNIIIVPLYEMFPSMDYTSKAYLYQKAVLKRAVTLIYKNDTEKVKQALQLWKEYKNNLGKAQILSDYLNCQKIDALYSFMEESNVIAGLCKKFTRAKIIVSERNFPKASKYSSSYLSLRNFSYAKADYIVFQTEEQRQFFSKNVQRKSCIIFNPVKKDIPMPFEGQRKKTIVNYCRFTKQKNLPMLICAFARIADEFPDYRLELYGNGDQRDVLEQLIISRGLSDKVALLPFRSNIHEIIKDCAMFVLSSEFEGMPNALLEAMAMGMPVISTDCLGGGAAAVIKNGYNGILIPRNDEEQLYLSMKKYIEDQSLAVFCGKNAEKIRTMLSIEIIAEKWLDLLTM